MLAGGESGGAGGDTGRVADSTSVAPRFGERRLSNWAMIR